MKIKNSSMSGAQMQPLSSDEKMQVGDSMREAITFKSDEKLPEYLHRRLKTIQLTREMKEQNLQLVGRLSALDNNSIVPSQVVDAADTPTKSEFYDIRIGKLTPDLTCYGTKARTPSEEEMNRLGRGLTDHVCARIDSIVLGSEYEDMVNIGPAFMHCKQTIDNNLTPVEFASIVKLEAAWDNENRQQYMNRVLELTRLRRARVYDPKITAEAFGRYKLTGNYLAVYNYVMRVTAPNMVVAGELCAIPHISLNDITVTINTYVKELGMEDWDFTPLCQLLLTAPSYESFKKKLYALNNISYAFVNGE